MKHDERVGFLRESVASCEIGARRNHPRCLRNYASDSMHRQISNCMINQYTSPRYCVIVELWRVTIIYVGKINEKLFSKILIFYAENSRVLCYHLSDSRIE